MKRRACSTAFCVYIYRISETVVRSGKCGKNRRKNNKAYRKNNVRHYLNNIRHRLNNVRLRFYGIKSRGDKAASQDFLIGHKRRELAENIIFVVYLS